MAILGSVEQIAAYSINRYWTEFYVHIPLLNSLDIPHSWSSHVITVNLGNLNDEEINLARAAWHAWEEVADIKFVETTGDANITFDHTGGSLIAGTNATWDDTG